MFTSSGISSTAQQREELKHKLSFKKNNESENRTVYNITSNVNNSK